MDKFEKSQKGQILFNTAIRKSQRLRKINKFYVQQITDIKETSQQEKNTPNHIVFVKNQNLNLPKKILIRNQKKASKMQYLKENSITIIKTQNNEKTSQIHQQNGKQTDKICLESNQGAYKREREIYQEQNLENLEQNYDKPRKIRKNIITKYPDFKIRQTIDDKKITNQEIPLNKQNSFKLNLKSPWKLFTPQTKVIDQQQAKPIVYKEYKSGWEYFSMLSLPDLNFQEQLRYWQANEMNNNPDMSQIKDNKIQK